MHGKSTHVFVKMHLLETHFFWRTFCNPKYIFIVQYMCNIILNHKGLVVYTNVSQMAVLHILTLNMVRYEYFILV